MAHTLLFNQFLLFYIKSSFSFSIHILDSERFACETCGKNYKRLASLKYHQKYDCGNYYNDCENCGRNYKYIRDLRHHQKYECGNGVVWKCPQCMKQLMRKSWKRHVAKCAAQLGVVNSYANSE